MRNLFATFTLMSLMMFSTGAWAQSIDGVPIGSTLPSAGKFTNLEATTQIKLGSETITNFSGIDDDKVKVSAGDTPGFLDSKIVAGTGVTVTPGTNTITISAPPVDVKDSADGVEILFGREFDFTYIPDGETEAITVDAVDLNGTALVISQTDPTVTLGGQARNVLAAGDIPDTDPVLQQVIVDLSFPLLAGNYKVKLSNTQGDSNYHVPLSEISLHNGSTWTEATDSVTGAAWSGRLGYTSVVFDNKMWVMGGFGGGFSGSSKNDVWVLQ